MPSFVRDRRLVVLIGLLLFLFALMAIFGPKDSLDVKFYYSGDQARDLLQNMGDPELRAYAFNEMIDLAFLLTYSAGLFILLGRLFSYNPFAVLLALAPGAFDLVETSTILATLNGWTPQSCFDWLGIFTALKWTCGALAGVALLIGRRRGFKIG